jgi:hypothetical protein
MNNQMMRSLWLIYALLLIELFELADVVHSLRPSSVAFLSRRAAIATAFVPVVVSSMITAAGAAEEGGAQTNGGGGGTPDRFDVDNFIRTGVVANPMGVSGQAGTYMVLLLVYYCDFVWQPAQLLY